MINAASEHHETAWRRELAAAIRDPAQLAAALALEPADLADMHAADRAFRLLVPKGFAARMRRGDRADPLLRQIVPSAVELAPQPPAYTRDPLGETAASRAPGLLVKYRGRALLVTTGACAVHCRYCFRRHFPYPAQNPRRADWDAALAAIAADPSLSEVILSGGDPLMLDDRELAGLAARLGAIPHLRLLRIHTRMPVVLPERVDAALLEWLAASRLPITMVLHANHPNELAPAVAAACARLRPAVRFLLNQSVLLAGVNDDAATLEALSRTLAQAGVLPYYLHLPDFVAGTAHFAVSEERGRDLIEELRVRLPGYLVPRLARESAGEAAKRVLA